MNYIIRLAYIYTSNGRREWTWSVYGKFRKTKMRKKRAQKSEFGVHEPIKQEVKSNGFSLKEV